MLLLVTIGVNSARLLQGALPFTTCLLTALPGHFLEQRGDMPHLHTWWTYIDHVVGRQPTIAMGCLCSLPSFACSWWPVPYLLLTV